MARVYADVNQQMPRSYWDYDSVNITWGILENYEVVRKIGRPLSPLRDFHMQADTDDHAQDEESIRKSSKASTLSTTTSALSRCSSR